MVEIRPQPGPQEAFLSSSADIVFYGGAAGGGKTWALLLEPLRHINNKDFAAVIFRRNSTQVRNPGGLWTESSELYPTLGATGSETVLEWRFPGGALVKFAHLEHEKTRLNWQGAQIPCQPQPQLRGRRFNRFGRGVLEESRDRHIVVRRRSERRGRQLSSQRQGPHSRA